MKSQHGSGVFCSTFACIYFPMTKKITKQGRKKQHLPNSCLQITTEQSLEKKDKQELSDSTMGLNGCRERDLNNASKCRYRGSGDGEKWDEI